MCMEYSYSGTSSSPAVQRPLTRVVYPVSPSHPRNSYESKSPPIPATTNVKRPLCDNPVNPLQLQL